MALINCPECKKEISDKALSCPACGFQISFQAITAANSDLTTIQETGKRLKAQLVISGLMFWISLVWLVINDSENRVTTVILCVLVFFSLIYFVGIKIRIWWNHK